VCVWVWGGGGTYALGSASDEFALLRADPNTDAMSVRGWPPTGMSVAYVATRSASSCSLTRSEYL
jgi:hypothetical protein